MDWNVTQKAARVQVVLDDQSLDRAVLLARQYGCAALTPDILPGPQELHYISVLLSILQADVRTSPLPKQRVNEYRQAFPILAQELTDEVVARLCGSAPLCETPAPKRNLVKQRPKQAKPEPRISVKPLELPAEVATRLGFAELRQIGRGGYGVVYMARQLSASGRIVVIKYTRSHSRELAMLAHLQHPNIMPVYSVHEHEGHRVLCMPLHGLATVADLLREIGTSHRLPVSGASLLEISRTQIPDDEVNHAVAETLCGDQLSLRDVAESLVPPDDEFMPLRKLNYADAVIQRFARLASALHHVHARRIIHLDIKPANILITNDGDFMILDFGLAHHRNFGSLADACGTARYMAPEQLRQFVYSLPMTPTAGMDLYALGLVVYELLTGKHPYARSMVPGSSREAWIRAREIAPGDVRQHEPSIPVGVASILTKLLAPQPSERYGSAEELVIDLTRHQENLPLRYARNADLRDSFAKFRRRHPVFSVAVISIALAAIALTACVYSIAKSRQFEEQQQQQHATETKRRQVEAAMTWEGLRNGLDRLRMDCASNDPTRCAAAVAGVEQWMARYGVDGGHPPAAWSDSPLATDLPDPDRAALGATLSELALLAAVSHQFSAGFCFGEDNRQHLCEALQWNAVARGIPAPHPAVAAASRQHREIARQLGVPAEPHPEHVGAKRPTDLFVGALLDLEGHAYAAAREKLEELVQLDAHHMGAQFYLGSVLQLLGSFSAASERYQIVAAVANTDARPLVLRARLLFHINRYQEAYRDYTTALERDPKLGPIYLERAMVSISRMKPREALADLREAERLGASPYRIAFARYECALQCDPGRAAMAQVVLDALEPASVEDFLLRGRLDHSPGLAQAIRDYTSATELEPNCAKAWQSLGAALAGQPEHWPEAVAALRRALALSPYNVDVRLQLCLVLARTGRQDEALKLAVETTQIEQASQAYRLACVISLTATDDTTRLLAIDALKLAKKLGDLPALLSRDTDLNNIRHLREYRTFVGELPKNSR